MAEAERRLGAGRVEAAVAHEVGVAVVQLAITIRDRVVRWVAVPGRGDGDWQPAAGFEVTGQNRGERRPEGVAGEPAVEDGRRLRDPG
jgi:hypothetical protein